MTTDQRGDRFTVRKQSSGYSCSVTYYVYDRQRKGRVSVHAGTRESAQADADSFNKNIGWHTPEPTSEDRPVSDIDFTEWTDAALRVQPVITYDGSVPPNPSVVRDGQGRVRVWDRDSDRYGWAVLQVTWDTEECRAP